jgi:F0F1-type ATP synthase assembly protein I
MIATGIYLYVNSRAERKEDGQKQSLAKVIKDFTFSWILLGLLIFYIVTIYLGSAPLFAAGNIVVEVILIVYCVRNRTKVPAKAS